MGDFLNRLREQVGTFLSGLTTVQKALLIGIVGVLLALCLFLLVRKGTTDNFIPMYSGLERSDREAIIGYLEDNKVPYKVIGEDQSIWVPKDRVRDIRAELAQEGLPRSVTSGFELFDRTPIGMTEFTQNVNFLRALQGEIERTIETIKGIEWARVHLVLTKETLFVEEKKPASASVVLTLRKNFSLEPEQVKGIAFLVSRAVRGLDPKSVSIVDMSGRILSYEDNEFDQMAKLTSAQYKIKRTIEDEIEKKLLNLLFPIVGSKKALVSVSAQLDFSKSEHTEESYDPDSIAVRSEERERESEVGLVQPQPIGVPGVMANVPPAGGQQQIQQQTTQKSKSHDITNYEVSKLIRHVVKPYGSINRLSVGVLLDGRYENEKYVTLSSAELGKIENLIKGAVGFNEDRGDVVRVVNIPFLGEGVMNERELVLEMARHEFWVNIAKLGLFAFALILMIFFVIRPILSYFFPKKEVPMAKPPEIEPEKGGRPDLYGRIIRASQHDPEVIAKALEKMIGTKEEKIETLEESPEQVNAKVAS